MASDGKRKEADAAMKEGDKLITKTLFRWKPDWMAAQSYYETAAKYYRTAKVYDLAKYCFKQLSVCQVNSDVFYLAAKSIESASAMAKETGNIQETTDLLIEASKLYRTNGNSYAAADAMAKAAKMLEDTDLKRAIELLNDCCELFELDDKEHYSGDTFKSTISLLLKHKMYAETVDLLLVQNRVFVKLSQTHDLHKSCLGAIVINLAMDDVISAKRRYEEFLIQEGTNALELIHAFENNDNEAVKKISSRPLFNFLDNQIAKIAKNLAVADSVTGAVGKEESVL
ncbi:hypothetical protein SAMD00019534_017530 [Acytostelium subglobosum LB1]|uniref:hypothetical protein n=1 Tax=Acytostelium subglobosum LB1 TaxID=1410327 RepID=UPI0006450678|nr:hypothetical protein SAMD00019534_017530 [Acytostelium subglobosum LB1]GAM18578.1 hypothetical protein SAMD00019534_017530 [Acytostelium subglobosum LB1]|eukprot:XP_012757798.1 hypothetical protein SAMD00019534_017530 [Acytostelium subglobosum LB1]